MYKERIIVSLTTYNKRIANIPVVLDTIFAQTMPPDFVVMNLAIDEIIPHEVQKYIDTHPIEVNRVPDIKVYKKLIPTLRKYPNDCVISIDDDFLYPSGMIEDFITLHRKYPDFPISGNREVLRGIQCHCGCASLMKLCYLGTYVELIDKELITHCISDDLVYTYLANMNGHPYIRTKGLYFDNMQSYNSVESYSISAGGLAGIFYTYRYLVDRFGEIDDKISCYTKDAYLKVIMNELLNNYTQNAREEGYTKGCQEICKTYSYKIGDMILKPLKMIRRWKE